MQPVEVTCVQDSNNESDYVLFFGPPRVAFESGITPGMHLIQNNRWVLRNFYLPWQFGDLKIIQLVAHVGQLFGNPIIQQQNQ